MQRTKRRIVAAIALAAAFPLLLTACATGSGDGGGSSGEASDVIVLAAQGERPPLDPHRMTGTPGLRVIDALYDGLVRENLTEETEGPAELEGALAEQWTVSDDGLVFAFDIREGVTFHDGTELNADAVKLNFDRFTDESSPIYSEEAAAGMKFITRWIASTAVNGDGNFEVTLSEPFPEFINLLSDRRAGIISPALLESADDDQIAATPVGTGPYMTEGVEQGADILLDRNPEYWRGEPVTPQLLFTTIADANTMVTALQTGQIDMILSAGSEQISQLEGDDSVTIQYPDPPNSYFIRLNTAADEATNNVLVRQALNYAVDREGIAQVMSGQAAPLPGAIPQGNRAWDSSVNSKYSYDPDQARELIEESGLPTPINIKLLAPSGGPGFSQSNAVMSLIQQNFADVGVELEVEFMEFTAQVALEGPGYTSDLNGSYNGWSTSVELAYWLENMFSPALQPPVGTNRGWYDNPELGDKFTEARSTIDDDARNDLYREAGMIIDEDAPWVFLYQDRLPRVFNSSVTGPLEIPSLFIDYATLEKTE